MVDQGIPAEFVDTQDVSLTNTTDSITYLQLTNVVFDIDSTVEKHQTTDNQIDNVFSLYMNSIEGNMRVTTPDFNPLFILTVDVSGVRPLKLWSVAWTDGTGNTVTTSFNGQMKTLRPIDSGLGVVDLFFRIKCGYPQVMHNHYPMKFGL